MTCAINYCIEITIKNFVFYHIDIILLYIELRLSMLFMYNALCLLNQDSPIEECFGYPLKIKIILIILSYVLTNILSSSLYQKSLRNHRILLCTFHMHLGC